MTTRISIVNSSESNKAQHSRVTVRKGSEETVTLLAPGEEKSWWISGDAMGHGDKITVVEVFAPKPTE